jgi:hypothetical protein
MGSWGMLCFARHDIMVGGHMKIAFAISGILAKNRFTLGSAIATVKRACTTWVIYGGVFPA